MDPFRCLHSFSVYNHSAIWFGRVSHIHSGKVVRYLHSIAVLRLGKCLVNGIHFFIVSSEP